MFCHLALYFAIIGFLIQSILCSSSQRTVPGCFPSCDCQEKAHIYCMLDSQFIKNAAKFNQFLRSNIEIPVHFSTSMTMVPEVIRELPVLRHVSLARNDIKNIQAGVFEGMSIQDLNLSFNSITTIHSQSLARLDNLETLDLSYNHLESVPKDLFGHLPKLKVLNLEHNALQIFPIDKINILPKLQVLLLNDNSLSFTAPGQLSGLQSLQVLRLQNNRLKSFDVSPQAELPSLQRLDVSGNPFRCSCGIMGLKEILHSNITMLENSASTMCMAADCDKQVCAVADIVDNLEKCMEPMTSIPFSSHLIQTTSQVELYCNMKAEPEPAIMWSTPWGHEFADISHISMLENYCPECRPERHYRVQGLTRMAEVSVRSNGRALIISCFSGSFNGNITCTALNRFGNKTAVHYVEAFSAVKSVILQSLVVGAMCAATSLCLGCVVGLIKLAVLRWCRCVNAKKDLRHSPVDAASTEDNQNSSHAEDECCKDESMDFDEDDYYPPETPFTTPVGISPTTSPKKSPGTPPGGAWLPSNILDTMEEVRWRLRYGVGRRVESMKRNVQSIKESGSIYVHNIMESGSTAANKVKAGVVLGVETVKYHVQSIREFCGTGDMGAQTVSMVSVETDVDTQKSREVIKSFTVV